MIQSWHEGVKDMFAAKTPLYLCLTAEVEYGFGSKGLGIHN
jgi:hypothetical protein